MKKFIIFFLVLPISEILFAQSNIVIVSGTSNEFKVAPTIDSALKVANDGDYIYLPGGPISAFTLNKRVFIYGAGHFPDSTNSTGRTVITGDLFIYGGASGGLLEGCLINGNVIAGVVNSTLIGFILKRCRMNDLFGNSNSNGNFFLENIINNVNWPNSNTTNTTNNYFQKNIIYSVSTNGSVPIKFDSFENNIFIGNSEKMLGNIEYCTFRNNIFLLNFNSTSYPNSSFYYNLSTGSISDGPFAMDNKSAPLDSIFVNYTANFQNIYTQDFHLKPNSIGKNMGTDGTDVGIYGTNEPAKIGWIPSNPHISLKNISSQTDANGYLKATFKVKAQSN